MAAPEYMLGEHLTTITIAPLTLTSGTWTPGTAVSILAYIQSVEHGLEVQSDDIRPVWSKQVNEVPHSYGETITIQCLQRSDALNTLNSLVRSTTSRRFQIITAEAQEDFTGYYTLRRASSGITSHGANTNGADFGPMDPGNSTAQVALA